ITITYFGIVVCTKKGVQDFTVHYYNGVRSSKVSNAFSHMALEKMVEYVQDAIFDEIFVFYTNKRLITETLVKWIFQGPLCGEVGHLYMEIEDFGLNFLTIFGK